MDTTKIFDWTKLLKLPPRIMCGLAIATGLILFLPDTMIVKLYLLDFRKDYGFWIGIIFITSVAILCCYFISYIYKIIARNIKMKKLLKRGQEAIQALSLPEKQILVNALEDGSGAMILSIEDKYVRMLEMKHIIIRTGSLGTVSEGLPYAIQPWAMKYLKENPEILEGIQPTNKNIYMRA